MNLFVSSRFFGRTSSDIRRESARLHCFSDLALYKYNYLFTTTYHKRGHTYHKLRPGRDRATVGSIYTCRIINWTWWRNYNVLHIHDVRRGVHHFYNYVHFLKCNRMHPSDSGCSLHTGVCRLQQPACRLHRCSNVHTSVVQHVAACIPA